MGRDRGGGRWGVRVRQGERMRNKWQEREIERERAKKKTREISSEER